MRRLQEEISGFDLGALSPSEPGWYERLGWERWQGPLCIVKDGIAEVTPDECVLIYRTPKTGALDPTASLTAEWRSFELWFARQLVMRHVIENLLDIHGKQALQCDSKAKIRWAG